MGGSFDPIHIGHLAMAQEAAEYYQLDKVLFIPTGKSPHKDRQMTSPEKRLEWVEMAVAKNPLFEAFDYESKKSTPSYTYETMIYLKERNPSTEFFYIVGEDSLLEIESWYRYKELLTLCTFLVARRSPHWDNKLEEKIDLLVREGYDIREIPFTFLDISSTTIREKFKKGKDPRYYLFEEVYKDIIKEKIYGKK